jgi:hypothetical protein
MYFGRVFIKPCNKQQAEKKIPLLRQEKESGEANKTGENRELGT